MSKNKSKIIVALDFMQDQPARELVSRLDPSLCRLKVGKSLFTYYGPALVEEFMIKGFDIFLDLKFHDIPQTVFNACRSAAKLGVWMLNVHALGGRRMMEAAAEALSIYSGKQKPLLIAVTLLTSLMPKDLSEVGLDENLLLLVTKLAKLAAQSGLDGVVCSAQEASLLRAKLGSRFLLVTPGIRLKQDSQDDQKRIMTPEKAITAGSDYLVMGRSITGSLDPLKILSQLNKKLP